MLLHSQWCFRKYSNILCALSGLFVKVDHALCPAPPHQHALGPDHLGQRVGHRHWSSVQQHGKVLWGDHYPRGTRLIRNDPFRIQDSLILGVHRVRGGGSSTEFLPRKAQCQAAVTMKGPAATPTHEY